MFKVNTNVIGIGKKCACAVDRLAKSDMPDIRTAVFLPGEENAESSADYVFSSKYDFLEVADKFFASSETVVFVLADCSDMLEISLACELSFITARMGGFSVVLAYMPSANSDSYSSACEALEELHDCFDGVVRFNESYCDGFDSEVAGFFRVMSGAMSSEAQVGIRGFEELKKLFSLQKDIYFASVVGSEAWDSHRYRAKCLEMKLSGQTYVDIANCLNFFYLSADEAKDEIINIYAEPLKKINIAFMNSSTTYVSDNISHMEKGEFIFGVMCSE